MTASYRIPPALAPGALVGPYVVRSSLDERTRLADGPGGSVVLHLYPLDPADDSAGPRFEREMMIVTRGLRSLARPELRPPHAVGVRVDLGWLATTPPTGVPLSTWCADTTLPWTDILAALRLLGEVLIAAMQPGFIPIGYGTEDIRIDPDRRPSLDLADVLATRLTAPTLHDLTIDDRRLLAPEQLTQVSFTHRTAQFLFAAVAWTALHRGSPFPQTAFREYAETVLAHRIARPPPRTDVPAWVRRVLARALHPDPAARWPAMPDLLAALTPRGLRRFLP